MVQVDISQLSGECNVWREKLRNYREEFNNNEAKLRQAAGQQGFRVDGAPRRIRQGICHRIRIGEVEPDQRAVRVWSRKQQNFEGLRGGLGRRLCIDRKPASLNFVRQPFLLTHGLKLRHARLFHRVWLVVRGDVSQRLREEAAKAIWFLCQQPASGVVSEMVLQPFNHQAI